MVCTSIKSGQECVFMSKKGCSYNGGACHPIIEACDGCTRTMQLTAGWYCTACPEPSIKWKRSACNLATHTTKVAGNGQGKLNPLKASKRGAR